VPGLTHSPIVSKKCIQSIPFHHVVRLSVWYSHSKRTAVANFRRRHGQLWLEVQREHETVMKSWFLTNRPIYTPFPRKKVSQLMYDNNFGKCGSIFKFLSLSDSSENYLCIHHKDFHLTCNMLLHYLWKSIQKCYWFWQHLNRLLTCSWGHFEDLI